MTQTYIIFFGLFEENFILVLLTNIIGIKFSNSNIIERPKS